jgi:hypothetical protein
MSASAHFTITGMEAMQAARRLVLAPIPPSLLHQLIFFLLDATIVVIDRDFIPF